jgi:hypothetical protein
LKNNPQKKKVVSKRKLGKKKKKQIICTQVLRVNNGKSLVEFRYAFTTTSSFVPRTKRISLFMIVKSMNISLDATYHYMALIPLLNYAKRRLVLCRSQN